MPITCAIRWDAWYGEATSTTKSTRAALSAAEYQFRAPFFAQVLGPNYLRFAPTQQTMSQEIAYAISGGIDCWAFLKYPSTSELDEGFNIYQANPNKGQINWCWMYTPATLANGGVYPATNWQAAVTEIVGQMQQSNYQKVLANRPLFYFFYTSTEVPGAWGNDANLKVAIDKLRTDAQAAGLGNPYVVAMRGSAALGLSTAAALGADAISSYISPIPDGLNKSYASLATRAQTYWAEKAATGAKVIPIVMTGFNSRPRRARPVPWEASTQRPYFGLIATHADATPSELTAHVQAAVGYVTANPSVCEADALLIYAWNEFDEGGWICPTLGDPTASRLAAVAAGLA